MAQFKITVVFEHDDADAIDAFSEEIDRVLERAGYTARECHASSHFSRFRGESDREHKEHVTHFETASQERSRLHRDSMTGLGSTETP